MQNSTCTVYSSRNFESDYYFDELQMNELSAKEVFDEIPDREEYHYPIVDMVVYDENDDDHDPLGKVFLNLDYISSKQLDNDGCDVVTIISQSPRSDIPQINGEQLYATQVFDGFSERKDNDQCMVD
ncbi:hypothetical protein LIER_15170 [Lithospermum erythrorhizon]|uniref:Uncharacterized protein n=1 Tax=Lithospermum erythrorhizon TaxID=34254 RepID=A0AAV3Q5X5_LITER